MSLAGIKNTWRRLLLAAMVATLATPSQPARAAGAGQPGAGTPRAGTAAAAVRTSTERQQRSGPIGRPTVELNRLTFPNGISEGSYYKSHLRRSLQREAHRADWGAGNAAKIEYRFRIDTLEIARQGGLVRVHCAATGQLPRGRTARSRLTFSGAASAERRLVREVLEIVARGVLTRLAQIEHARRQSAGI
jgi:hypothetical protein